MTSKPSLARRDNITAGRIGKDWTQGNILKNLISLSWPMTVTQTLMSLGPTIDMIWVGKLGSVAVAAVGVSGVVVQLAQGLMMGLTTGMRAVISRAIGAKDTATASHVALQAVVVTAIYSVLMALVGYFFGEKIVSFITSDPEVVRVGTMYLRIGFIGGATMTFRLMMDAVMQSSGDSINPMSIAIVFRLFHIALCPFLIFGWWIFPELGVKGAAYTGVIAQTLGIILGLIVLTGTRSRLRLNFRAFHLDFNVIWRIIRIGFPASVTGMQRSLNQFFLQTFMAAFGVAVLAAHVITQRLEMFILMPAMAFGQGAGVLVGQNLGAKQPERAQKTAWQAAWLVEAFVIVTSLAIFIWDTQVIHIFNNDPSLDAVAIQFVHIAAFGWAVMGFTFVMMNSLQGAGDTVPTMVINVTTTWLITIPFAYFLPKYTNWGAISIRWAITASSMISAAANVIYFRTGKWKTRRV